MSDNTPPEARCCASCACSIELPSPQGRQLGCRRDPPLCQDQRVEVPDPKNPKRMISVVQRFIFPKPTEATAVCYDGWRPLGTLPGQIPVAPQLPPTAHPFPE